jgi:hypothetical protein
MSGEPPKPLVSWLGRFIRGRRLDRNPLRRTSDRVETAVLAALVVTFLVAGPLVALACGSTVHATAQRTQVAERSSRYQIRAVVLNEASQENTGNVRLTPEIPEVRVRWSAPEGNVVTGEVPVSPGTADHTTVLLWTTRDGQLTDPPLTGSQVAARTWLAAVVGDVILASLLAIAGLLVRLIIDRRQKALWDADWITTGPRWWPHS